jgi:hypothetical protein
MYLLGVMKGNISNLIPKLRQIIDVQFDPALTGYEYY